MKTRLVGENLPPGTGSGNSHQMHEGGSLSKELHFSRERIDIPEKICAIARGRAGCGVMIGVQKTPQDEYQPPHLLACQMIEDRLAFPACGDEALLPEARQLLR